MPLYSNSLSFLILEYLAPVGVIPRKDLRTPFVYAAYSRYAKTVRRLLAEDYIEIKKINKINHLPLTHKGANAIKAKREEEPTNVAKATNAKARKRQLLVAEAKGLCVANGFYTEVDKKPNLSALYQK